MEEKVFYITKEKLKEIEKECERLSALEHKKIMGEEAPKILESEDMNPEFISFQEDIDSLRAKIEELQNIIDRHQLIKAPPKEKRIFVDLGARVKVETGNKNDEFTIVGTLEANPSLGKISNESPIGKALLGRKAGEEVAVFSPAKKIYKIKKIKYETI